ncbi:MAG: N,N-dimethylformamidase beta subunit family domain-containing protein, partial [Aestuariivirgaceae bacterium]
MSDKLKLVPLAGYSDRLSLRPGETAQFKVSSQTNGPVKAWLTRSISADPNPEGMGVAEVPMDDMFTPIEFAGRNQPFYPGSYAITQQQISFDPGKGFKVGAIVFPTLEKSDPQTIFSAGGLVIATSRQGLVIEIGNVQFRSAKPLGLRTWQQVEAAYDPQTNSLTLSHGTVGTDRVETAERTTKRSEIEGGRTGKVVIAAKLDDGLAVDHFNGKIEAPYLEAILGEDDAPTRLSWDFSLEISSTVACETSAHQLHADLVNYPTRGVTGAGWDAREMCWRHAPDQYAAIHFHETDIYDFQWQTDFSFTAPDDLPSGAYMMHIGCGDHHDAMPIFVCAPYRKPRAKLCLLVSTFTYTVYG